MKRPIKNPYQILSFATLLMFNTIVNAEEMTVEWAPFVKKAGVTHKQLISKADVVNSGFLIKQKGFIKRELVKKNNSEFADIIYWQTKADAIAAGEKVNTCSQCAHYFELMDMEMSTGEGFTYYSILKSWSH